MRYVWLVMALLSFGFAEPYRVVFVQDDMKNDFRRTQVLKLQEALSSHKEIAFTYFDSHAKTSTFIYNIQKAINMGADLLVVGVIDCFSTVPILTKAYERGMKVIILDRGISSKNYTTFINSDNIAIGRTAGEYIVAHAKKNPKVLLLEGLPNSDVTRNRTQGFLEAIEGKGVVLTRAVGNYLRRDTVKVMEAVVARG